MRKIIALSGPGGSGKSTLAARLASWSREIRVFQTRQMIQDRMTRKHGHYTLRDIAERLDQRTSGKWVAESLAKQVIDLPSEASSVVDSIHTTCQINGLRKAFGNRVIHVHLTAPPSTLRRRCRDERCGTIEVNSSPVISERETKGRIHSLQELSDVVIDTGRCTKDDVLVRTAARLGLYDRGARRLIDVLVGGQWGSEGKGHVASYLAREYDILLRVGGPNAGHSVYRDSRPIAYYHLPSGTQECEAQLVIGPGAVLDVEKLVKEIASARFATNRLHIDPQAMTIESADIEAERKRLVAIGSTKQGVGFATSRKLLRSAASPKVELAGQSPALEPYIRSTRDVLDDAYRQGKRILLEGTQGSGLSLHHGKYPYVTSRDTTASGCIAEAGIAPSRVRRTIMVVRSYPIRVGGEEHSGPMGNELSFDEISLRSGQDVETLRANERTSTTNRPRRIAEFNWTLLRDSALLNGPTDIALSFTDYISRVNEKARRFEQLTPETINFVEEIERVACAPVSLVVTRFSHSYRSIIDRRMWSRA